MDDKIVKVIFKEGWETMYSNDLTKCDYGQVLQIEGITLPDGNVEVHFSLTEHNGEAPISIGKVKDKVITVDIPDFILTKNNTYNSSYEAYAWIYVTDGESGRTIRKIVFTIDTRAEPTTNVPEDQKDKFLQEVRQVMAETKEVAQSVRDDADNGKFSGIPGPPGEDGKSAYQYAVEGGFKGTEQEFIDSMGTAGGVDLTGYVSKEQHEAELLKAMVKVTTDKAPFHHITDSANMKVLDFGMEGITEQETTPGNQLFDISICEGFYLSGGTLNNVIDGNKITVTNPYGATMIGHLDLGVLNAGTYTLSFTSNYSSDMQILIGEWVDSRTSISIFNNSLVTFTIEESVRVWLMIGIDNTNPLVISDIMLNKGTTALPIEKYVGGMPSPNPEHEEEITLAGVLNEETGRYEHKCCVGNKNLLDCTDFIKYQPGTDQYQNSPKECTFENGVLTLLKSVGTYNQMYVHYNLFLIKNVNYCICCNETSVVLKDTTEAITVVPSIDVYNKNNKRLHHADGSNTLSFTVSETGVYRIEIIFTKDFKSITKVEVHDLQMVYGNVDTDFVSHASQPFTLTSDRPITKWDYKAKRDGLHGWSIWSGEYVLNSTKNYNVSEWGDLVKFAVYGVPTISNRNEAVCEQFRFVSNPQTLSPQQEAIDWTGTTLQVWLHKDRGILDAESFKAYLEENPIKIRYHASEEQAFIPLPDEEQTLLHNLETYYGVTNVYNEQGCPMWIKYVADQELHWNQKLLQIQQAII